MAEPALHEHRLDFQGLRAIAVLAVIGYHFGIAGFSGGFAGVNIFFVLSGFFITRLLLRDIAANGRVRLGAFWLARAKRLLPNSTLALLATLGASSLLLPPYRFPAIALDTAFAAVFLANLHFAVSAIDYFKIAVPPSPVLHFWSLAVEEQFYVALPIVMTLLPRRLILAALAGLAVASFLAAVWVIQDNQPAAFFYPQYRAWELILGGLVALAFQQRHRVPQSVRAMLAWIGLALVAGSISVLDDASAYPGLWALLPTMGTAALLLGLQAGRATVLLDHVLSFPPMTAIGDMSYSLYLWHWPVAVILAAHWPNQPLALVLALLLAAGLAAVAYWAVERPVHRMPLEELEGWRIAAGAATGVAGVLLAASSLGNFPSTVSSEITQAIATAQADKGEISDNGCFLHYEDVTQPLCRAGDLAGSRRVVLFGDSHATQWYLPLSIAAQNAGWVMELRNKSSCPPADVTVWYVPLKSRYEPCDRWRAEQIADFLARPPDLVVLSGSSHYDTRLFDRSTGRRASADQDQRLWKEGVLRTVQTLRQAGIGVLEVRDTPRLYENVLDCLSAGDWAACSRPASEALAGLTSPLPDWPVLDFTDALCPGGLCAASQLGKIIYRDSEHLTYGFPAIFAPRFEAVLRDLG